MPIDLIERLDAGVELLGRADEPAPTPSHQGVEIVGPATFTVPPIDTSRAQRRQRIQEFNAIPTALDNAASSSEFGRGLSRGVLQVGSGLAGFGEIFADLVGADTAKSWLKGKGDYLAELSAAIPSAVENFTQIRNLSDLGAYTAAAIGELVPQIGLSFGAGGLAARGAATAGSAILRGTAAAGATSYTQEAGGMYRGIRDETGQEAPLTALAFGVPAAALDVLTPARFLGKVFDSASDELKSKAWTALVKRSFVEAARAAPIEGLTESMQESIAVSANKFADSTYDAINGKNFIRVLDAGLRGVIGGGVIGATVPFVEGRGRQETGGIDDTPPRIVSAEIPPQPPPPNAPTPIPQQPGAVTQPARDVSVVQTPQGEERIAGQYSGQLLGPTQESPSPGKEGIPLGLVGPLARFGAGQLSRVSEQDLQQAVDHYGVFGAGFSRKFRNTGGITRSLRKLQNIKLWEDMTPVERLDEFRASALNDLRVAVTEAENPVDYMLDRALNQLDGMAGLYRILLKSRGADVSVSEKGWATIKLSKELEQERNSLPIPELPPPTPDRDVITGEEAGRTYKTMEEMEAARLDRILRLQTPVTPPVAPVPVPVAEPTPPPPPPTGPRWQAQTPAGEATVSGVWRVSSARDLVTSFDTGYDSTLQPRDRSRLASREQIATIASNLDVNRVGESPTTNLGAPIGNAASRVLSGNGRVAAFRMIYDAAGRTADELRSFVRQRAADLGLNADEVAAIPDPVLWREVVDYGGLDPVQFSILSNQSDVMGMSPGEKAVSDTRMLERNPALLDMFLPSEDGDVLAASNREFLNRFIQATGDQATLMSAEGYNGPVLTKRVKNAMAGLLIGAEDSTLMRDLLEESEATGIKRVADAVIASVPLMMRLRGTRYDLGPAIAQALRDLLRIKKGNEKIYDFLGHRSLFGDPLRTALSDMMLGIMHQAKSIKALVGVLQRYHALARKTLDDLAGIAPPTPAPTREQILQAAYETTDQTKKPAVQEGFTFGQPQAASGQSPGTVAPGTPPQSGGTQGPLASVGPASVVTPAPEASVPFTLQPSGILNDLRNIPFTPAQKAVYDALIKGGFGSVPFRLINDPTKRYGGGFVGARGFILNVPYLMGRPGYAKKAIIHEAVHAATWQALRTTKYQSQADKLKTLLAYTQGKTGYWNRVKAAPLALEFDHALRNVDEFIAAALTSPKFQKYLSTLKPNSRSRAGKARKFVGSVLDKFWEIVSSIFGVKPSVLSEVLAITDDLISAGIMTAKDLGETSGIPTVADFITVEQNEAVRQTIPPSADPGAMPEFASLGPTLKAADLEKTIAFTPDPATQQTEAIMASGQVTELFEVIKDKFATLANQFIPPFASDRTKRLERAATVVNVTRLQGIEDTVTALGVTPKQFDDALALLTNEGEKTTLGLHFWNWFTLFESQARKNAVKFAAAQKLVLSPGFQQKIRRARGQLNKADVAIEARRLIVSQLKDGLAQAQKRAGQAGVNETLFATANVQIRLFNELLQRVDPIERRMQEIIVAANNNPTFFQAIIDGTFTTPEELLNAYMATSPRLPGPGPEMVELRVAADILFRTRELALRMTAAEASEDAAVNQAVTDIESRVRKSVDDKNFRTTVHNILRTVVSLATKEGKALAIFKIAQRPLVRQMELLEAREFGDAVFTATMADPRYVAMRNRANELVGAFTVPAVAFGTEQGKTDQMAVPLANPILPQDTIIMPNGERRLFKMLNNQAEWATQMPVLERTLDELTDWLVQNPDDPARGFYEWERDTLNAYWHNSVASNPPNMEPAFKNLHFKLLDVPLKELDSVIGQVGGRAKQSAIAFEGILKDSMHLMQEWTARNLPNLTRTIIEAVKSHPEIKGANFTAIAEEWYYDVLNPLEASHRDPTRPGYRVGEIIPHSGYRVTREDMNAAQRQAKASKDAHDIDAVKGREKLVTQPLVEDQWIPGVKSLRGVLTTSPMMVPRKFGKSKGANLASQYIKEVLPDSAARANAARAGTRPVGSMTSAQFWRHPNRWRFVKEVAIERSPEYSTVSTFEDAFREATAEMQRDPDAMHDMDTLVAFMSQWTTSTPQEIEAFIVSELDRMVNAFINAIPSLVNERNGEPLKPMTISQWEQTNSFTTGRGKALATSAWYEYGFKDTRDILNFSASGNSFFLDMYVQSLREIARHMTEYKSSVIQKRIDELKGDKQKAFAQNKEDVRMGKELLLWESVDDYIIGLNKIADEFHKVFAVGGKEVDLRVRAADIAMSRLVGGVLFNWIGTLRNAHESGGFWNGVRLSRLEGSILKAFPRAYYHMLKTTILLGRHVAPAIVRAGIAGLKNIPGAVRTGFSWKPKDWLKAEAQLLGESIDLVSEGLFGVRELNDQLNARGIGMTVTPSETAANLADLWESGGVIREVQSHPNPLLRAAQTLLRFTGTAYDVQLALFARPFAPRLGDRIANETIASSTLAALKSLEKRLRKLAYTFQQAGVNPAGHRFTANEIFNSFPGFDRSMSDIRFVEQWFADSNVDFHQSVADFFQRLYVPTTVRTGPNSTTTTYTHNPTAEWLTAEDRWRLAVRSAEVINVATGFNRALAIKANFFTRMIGMLMGWNLHAYRQVSNYLGRSSADDKSAFRIRSAIALWTLAILAASAGSAIELEWLIRMIARLMGEPERATRLPFEWERGSDQAKSLLVYSTMNIPFIAATVSSAFNDLPNRASLSPYTLGQNLFVRTMNYIGGAVNSGDPTFGLVPLVKGFVPGTSVALNRLPYAQGLMPAIDSTRLLTRYADKDMLRRPWSNTGPGASANVTPLSPFGDRIISAIGRGDDQQAEVLYGQAVQAAKRMGKLDPDASVRSMIVNRLPISRALKSTPSAADYQRILGRMSPFERGKIEAFTVRAEQGLARLNVDTGKLRPLPPVRTSGSTRGRTARSRMYRVKKVRLNRVSRGRLVSRRRNRSLVRSVV